jgi:hypothetical protein
MNDSEIQVIGWTIPLSAINAVRSKYERTDWFQRASLVCLSIVAAKNAGINVGDLVQRWVSAHNDRKKGRSKEVLKRLRDIEQEAIALFGEAVELCISDPPLLNTARCGMVEARQKLVGDDWGVVTEDRK